MTNNNSKTVTTQAGMPATDGKSAPTGSVWCGYGKYDTTPDKVEANNQKNGGTRRSTMRSFALSDLHTMAEHPQLGIDKSRSMWITPSNYCSRQKSVNQEHGKFYYLSVDSDEKQQSIDEIKAIVDSLLVGDYILFTTASHDPEAGKTKYRLIVPLVRGECYEEWHMHQVILNDKMEEAGIPPDRSNESANQLAYLPNAHQCYEFRNITNKGGFDPSIQWLDEELEFKFKVEEQSAMTSIAKAEKANDSDKLLSGASLIRAFNEKFTVEHMLLLANYEQNPSNPLSFNNPNSESRNYATNIDPETGRVNSLSTSDLLHQDKGGHDAFSVFQVLFCGDDRTKSLITAGNEWVVDADGNSWNSKHRDTPTWVRVGKGKNGTPLAVKENLIVLMDHLGISGSYDVIKKCVIIRNVDSLLGEEENTIIAKLKSSSNWYRMPKSVVDDQLSSIMNSNAVNPITQWLSSIQRTRTGDPIADLVGTLPIVNYEWAYIAFKRWLIQCCAAADYAKNANNPTALAKFESVLVFFGAQGTKKTAFIRAILPKELSSYVIEGVSLDLNSKDSILQALSGWITELGELDSTFKRSDISAIKAFLSKDVDVVRKPYAKAASKMPRQTSFMGSVNEEKFLRDDTGNRRYFPLVVTGKLLVADDFDCVDLWAYAWELYTTGNQWWLTDQEEVLQKTALAGHHDDLMKTILTDFYDFDKPERNATLTSSLIMQDVMIPINRSNQTKLGKTLKQLGISSNRGEYKMPSRRNVRNSSVAIVENTANAG
jgi:hypothetical protein